MEIPKNSCSFSVDSDDSSLTSTDMHPWRRENYYYHIHDILIENNRLEFGLLIPHHRFFPYLEEEEFLKLSPTKQGHLMNIGQEVTLRTIKVRDEIEAKVVNYYDDGKIIGYDSRRNEFLILLKGGILGIIQPELIPCTHPTQRVDKMLVRLKTMKRRWTTVPFGRLKTTKRRWQFLTLQHCQMSLLILRRHQLRKFFKCDGYATYARYTGT